MHKIELGRYKGLNITPAAMYTESDLELAVIESTVKLANHWAKKNKAIGLGDQVVVTLQAECKGMFVPELSKSNFKYTVGDPSMLEQFKQVLNKKEGDCFLMEIPFPENSPIERIRGKVVSFKVTVQELFPAHQIDITDDIARKIDPEVSSLSDLKYKLREIISQNWLQMIKENNIQSILNAIRSDSKYELDREEFDKVYKQIVTQAQKDMFSITDQKMLESLLMTGNDEYFYDDCRLLAEKNIVEDLVLSEIIRLEKIMITDDEFETKKNKMASIFQDKATFEKSFPSDDILRDYLIREKTIELLLIWNLS